MKVYVLTAGSYSDYHIVSVFTDENKANQSKDWLNQNTNTYDGSDNYYIEEYESDKFAINDARKPFRFEFDLERNLLAPYEDGKNGNLPMYGTYNRKGNIDQKDQLLMHCNFQIWHSQGRPKGKDGESYPYNSYVVWCHGRNEDHAFKVATEMLQRFMAEKALDQKICGKEFSDV